MRQGCRTYLRCLPCSQMIATPSVTDVTGSSRATRCLSLKPSDRGIPFFKVFSFRYSPSYDEILVIYFDSVTSVLLGGEQKQVQKSTYPKISAAVAVCGRKHITSKVILSLVLNASFIFFKIIYNIIDFRAIVKGKRQLFSFKYENILLRNCTSGSNARRALLHHFFIQI